MATILESTQITNKYQLLEELGRGSTSVVYRAHDPFANREVAIKVFKKEKFIDEIERKKFTRLFLAEASMAGKLNHPHIVSIYDAVVNDELNYLVMEVIDGTALDFYGKPDNLLPVESLMQMMFKCCGALDFACKQGVIHRDIKPANILLTKDGDIKISDFGAALTLNTEQTQIEGIGSPAYMSPEQVKHEALTHQTDIYSLGVTMFKLLTGRLPYGAENTFSLMHKIVSEPPLSLRELCPNLPITLINIVHKAMEKEPRLRYQHWSEMANDLTACALPSAPSSAEISDSEKFNALKKLSFFKQFNDVELWELLRISQWGKFSAGKVLVKEGEIGNSFYLLSEGEVFVTKSEKILATLGKGDCFGEMAYIDKASSKRSASIIAAGQVTLIKIKASALEQASENLQLQFNREFLKILVRRLANTNNELAAISA